MNFKIVFGLLLCSFVLGTTTEDYEGYKIYDISTHNNFEKQLLLKLSRNTNYDFFNLPRDLNEDARAMVAPEDQREFEAFLQRYNFEYAVVDENFGATLSAEKAQNAMMLRFPAAAIPGSISFSAFQRFKDINAYLDELAVKYPSRVTVKVEGQSFERRDIKTIRITNGDGRTNKNVIFVDAGIHAREWIAPAAALYIIKELVENFAPNAHLLNDYDWIILPVVNPDGYEYTHTNNRMWRKTRRPVSNSCWGTDGNRNFDFHWGEVGASNSACADTFKGTTAFSESETQIVRDILLAARGRGKFYLTIHSYGDYLLYPWGWTSALPTTWRDHDDVARAGANAILAQTGRQYKVGSSTNVLYAAAGGSDDYAHGVANWTIAITMELPGGGTGFDPTTAQILPFVKETWVGIKAMANKIIEKY